ncbi:MAG: hypothetical protein E6Q97_10540 [Desulfurellales bacterium]|nr:MAG: hypothetical protein E6Q97_10540 [Desulfurellales bacterium]
MKCYIQRSCGHESEEQLLGPDKDRKRKKEWFEKTPCCVCWKAAREQAAEKNGLPTLTGSEKQIKWAFNIREEFHSNISEKIGAINNPAHSERVAAILLALEEMLQEASAKFWIENRNGLKEILFAKTGAAK